jgi:hypothetical protein
MNDAEFWLLTLVAEMWCPIYMLTAENLSEILNTGRVHGLTTSKLADALHGLFQRGDIVARGQEHFESDESFLPTREDLDAVLAGKWGESVFYGLSPQGAERWEARAKPDWTRYLIDSYSFDPDEGEAIASECRVLDDWLALVRDFGPFYPVAGSERWDVLVPWQTTYWKTLPLGQRVRFRHVSAEPDRLTPDWHLEWERRRTWWSQYLTDCYDSA